MKATTALLGLTALPFVVILGIFGILLLFIIAIPGGGDGALSTALAANQTAGNNVPTSGKGAVSLSELVGLAHNAGIPNDALAMAVAIAEAESGGNPNAVDNDSNGSVDRGLWQINSTWEQKLPGNEFNPEYNATSMAFISQGGTDWSPWVTYQTGAYLTYLPEAQQAVAQAGY